MVKMRTGYVVGGMGNAFASCNPLAGRINTRDSMPAVTHVDLVPGNHIEITIAAKGGGSKNKARFAT